MEAFPIVEFHLGLGRANISHNSVNIELLGYRLRPSTQEKMYLRGEPSFDELTDIIDLPAIFDREKAMKIPF